MDAQQQKTFVGIVLIVLLGATACCGLTVAIGGFLGYQEAVKKTASVGPSDAGRRLGPPSGEEDLDEDAELMARFVAELEDELEAQGRDDLVYQPERSTFESDAGMVLSLDNLFAEYRALPEEERPAFVSRAVRGVNPPEVPATWAEAQPRVLATVRDRVFVELLALRSDKPLTLLQRRLADDLVELVVYDSEDSMQYLTEENCSDWGKSADEVFKEGRKNLAARSADRFKSAAPGVFESPWADNNDIGRVLLFDQLRRLKVKGDPVVFLPQRDHLVVTGANDPAGLAAAAELVDEYLGLPRANTGRGWRLTRQGLSPFIPPADDEILVALRQEADAKDANEQKQALDEYFERQGTDIFVGTTLFTEDDQGLQRTYAVWTKGADTLMPHADYVVFVDLDRPEDDRVVAAARWDLVLEQLGRVVQPDDTYWPRRYRVKTFPTARQLERLGTDPIFQRRKGE